MQNASTMETFLRICPVEKVICEYQALPGVATIILCQEKGNTVWTCLNIYQIWIKQNNTYQIRLITFYDLQISWWFYHFSAVFQNTCETRVKHVFSTCFTRVKNPTRRRGVFSRRRGVFFRMKTRVFSVFLVILGILILSYFILNFKGLLVGINHLCPFPLDFHLPGSVWVLKLLHSDSWCSRSLVRSLGTRAI